MSTTVDQRVVEMKFDNQHFERNVSTTMSTLDKLKQKLKFSDASKGLEGISKAARGVNLAPISNATETVGLKFNAMYTMADQALRNITNSAMNAGKRIVSALTIDPVKTGLQEYETQINAIQTILSNTESKGTTIDDVTKALDELNEYADMTIYNFTEMTRNIGTFTAAGVDLDTSVNAIKGIANLAASSGSTSQQASTAMYQISQALASGTVKLMDWNSVVNAGMGGQLFQDALKETARVHGVNIDAMIEKQGSFRETLSEGWLTSEILTDTLQKFTLTTEGLTDAQIEANREMLRAKGYTEEQIDGIFKLGNSATDAATKVKTFTQLWDTLKETAQSGWTQTWELIFGDFYEARDFFSGLYTTISSFLDGISKARNDLLSSALGKGLGSLKDKLNGVTKPVKTVVEKVDEAAGAFKHITKTLEEHEAVVDEVIHGKWGHVWDRWNALTDAGYDWVHVQNMVNAQYDCGIVRTSEWYEWLKKQETAEKKVIEADEELAKSGEKIADTEAERIAQLAEKNEEELELLGLTKDQIAALKELEKISKKLGIPMEDILTNIDEINGRWLLVNGVKNILNGLLGTFKAVGEAWRDAFPPMSADTLFDIIAAVHRFTTKLTLTEEVVDENGNTITVFNERGEKLARTLKGLFAIIDIVATIIGGGFRIALKIVTSILGYFNLDLLDVTANVGDALVRFRDWFDSLFDISWILDRVVPFIKSAATATGEWFKKVKESKVVTDFTNRLYESTAGIRNWYNGIKDAENPAQYIFEGLISGLKSAGSMIKSVTSTIGGYIWKFISGILDFIGFDPSGFVDSIRGMVDSVKAWLSGIKGAENIPMYLIQGFVNGLKSGVKFIVSTVWNLGKSVLETLRDVFDTHSPSRATFEIAWDCILGFANAIVKGLKYVLVKLKDFAKNILDYLSTIDFGQVLSLAFSAGLLVVVYKLAKGFEAIGNAFGGLGDVLEGTGKVLTSFSGTLKAFSLSLKAKALKDMAIGIAILAGTLIALTMLYTPDMWKAVGIIGALAGILLVMTIALHFLSKSSASFNFKDGFEMTGITSSLFSIGLAILAMALAVKMIADLDPDAAKQGFLGLGGLVVAIGLVLLAFGKLVKGKSAQNIDKLGKMMTKMAVALLLLVLVVKLVGKLEWAEMGKGAAFIGAFALFVLALTAISLLAGKRIDKMGGMLLKMSIAMLLLVGVVKLASKLKPDELKMAGDFIAAFLLLVFGLALISKFAGNEVKNLGTAMLAISVSMLILVGVIKIMSKMKPEEMYKGLEGVIVLSIVMLVLMAAVKAMGPDVPKLAGTLIAMSVAIGILAVVAVALSLVKEENLIKGVAAVAALGLIVAVMLRSAKGATAATGAMIAMAAMVAILAGTLITLTCLDPVKAILAATALGIVLGMFSLVLLASSKAKGAMSTLIVLSVAMAVLGAALIILAQVPWQQSLAAAGALSIVMLAMTAVLVILGAAQSLVSKAMPGVLGLLALTGVLFVLSLVMQKMAGVANVITIAQAMANMLLAMTVVLLLLTPVGYFIGAAMAGILGLVGFITAMGTFIAAVGWLITTFPQIATFIDTGIPLLERLASGIGSIIASFITGFVGELLTILPMIGQAFSAFMVAMQPAIMLLKMVDESVVLGAGYLAAAIIALTVAELISGIASFMPGAPSLPELGTQLSLFMANAMPFLLSAKLIGADTLEGIKSLAEAILILTAANLIEGITSFFGGSSSLEKFGTEIGHLGTGLKTLITNLEGVEPEQMDIVNDAADALKKLAEVSKDIPNTGGLLGDLVGNNDLGTFADQFPKLGTGLAQFIENIGDFDETKMPLVNAAADAVAKFAEVAKDIPNEGGWAAKILGDNSMGTFAVQFPKLAEGLVGFIEGVGDKFDSSKLPLVEAGAKAVKTFSDAAKDIPNEGGWAAKMFGDNSMGTFAAQFPKLAEGLVGFLEGVGDTFGEAELTKITFGAQAVKAIADAAKDIPNEGGWITKIIGDNSLSNFAEQMPKLGTGISGFVANLGTFNQNIISTVNAAVKALTAITGLAGVDFENISNNVANFDSDIESLGTHVVNFCGNFESVSPDTLLAVKDRVSKVGDIFENMGSFDLTKADTFVQTMKDLADVSIDNFLNSFTSETRVTDITTTATVLIDTFTDAISSEPNKMNIKTACIAVATNAMTALSDETVVNAAILSGEYLIDKFTEGMKDEKSTNDVSTTSFSIGFNAADWLYDVVIYGRAKSSGKNLLQGFIDGMDSKRISVLANAKSIASSVLNTMTSVFDEHSPSKETYKIGAFAGQGLVNALRDFVKTAYKTGAEVATSAKNGMSDAISKIRTIIDNDMDSQPTIRPVLDLSDVETGVRSIGSMFGSTAALGVNAHLGSISSMMNERRQNGTSMDVVEAIDKLRDGLGGLGNTSYTINGITYDDGSNIHDAVSTLIRAAKIERRV